MKKFLLPGAVFLTPLFAFAADTPSFKNLVTNTVIPIGSTIVNLLYALAFIGFLIGIFRFFFLGGAENREKGTQFALWGIIGFAVLFSVWGLVRLLLSTVGVNS